MPLLKSIRKDIIRWGSVARVREAMEMGGEVEGHILTSASAISDSVRKPTRPFGNGDYEVE